MLAPKTGTLAHHSCKLESILVHMNDSSFVAALSAAATRAADDVAGDVAIAVVAVIVAAVQPYRRWSVKGF